MYRKGWFLQEGENGGEQGGTSGGGGTGAKAVDAATARTFLADFVHDPKAIEGLDDKAIVDYHGRVTGAIDKVRPASGGKWPDTWRTEFAAGDEKVAKQLERYATPADVWKKARSLEQQLSSGEYKRTTPFPEKGTAEEQNAWRKEQGIPESPDKYEIKLDGITIGEADKPGIDAYLKYAHAANLAPDAVNKNLKWFFEAREQGMKAGQEATAKVKQETEDALRGEWGADYRRNVDIIDGFLTETLEDESMRKDMGEAWKVNPVFAKWMVGVARMLNPTSTVLPGAGGNQAQALSDEIASLRKMMGDKNSAYWQGADAAKNQERYRALLAAQDRVKKAA